MVTDEEAEAIINKIAKSTQDVRYMVAQVQFFLQQNPTINKYMILKWIRESNPVLADNMTKWII
jgi:hypothetical protein